MLPKSGRAKQISESKRHPDGHSLMSAALTTMTSLNFALTSPAFFCPPFAFIGPYGLGPFLIPIAGLAFAFGVILIGALEKAHREKLRHDTIQRALEKGQPLPPELFGQPGKSLPPEFFKQFAPRPRDDRRGGLIAIGVGIGTFVFFDAMQSEGVPDGVKWLALIPGLVGVALLINWALERGGKNDQDRV
jgi:hypothetical protein